MRIINYNVPYRVIIPISLLFFHDIPNQQCDEVCEALGMFVLVLCTNVGQISSGGGRAEQQFVLVVVI